MPAEKYTETYLTEQLPAEIKEHQRTDDLDPTRLPTYQYLNAKGFDTRGLNNAIQRHYGDELTLHQLLKQQGFGHGNDEWPTQNNETIKHLNGFRKSRRQRNDDRDATVSTMESSLRAILRTAQELHDIDNLFSFVRHESEEERHRCNEQIEAILDHIKQHKSDGAAENYSRYLKFFYDYASIRTRVDKNPVRQVESQYNFDTTPQREPRPLKKDEIQSLWKTAKQLPERRTLTDSIKNITVRYGLRRWQIYMMVILLLGVAVGPRSSEYVRTNCREDWYLEEGYIEFPVRKNSPGEVPILAHPEFLEAYREYMERINEDWNGKPFPSTQSTSGSVTKTTLNNWLKALCEEAEVRSNDGSYLTLQNLRQTWHTEYLKTLRVDDVRLELVADEAGTKDPTQPKMSYRSDEEQRKSIRSLATGKFEELLPLSELPDEMSKVVDETKYIDTQVGLDNF